MIRSKSITKPAELKDGIRVCIMRKPPQDAKFDIWIPDIAPTAEVLSARHAGTMTFDEHRHWFQKNVFQAKPHLIQALIDLARNQDITIMCVEEDPEKCHRSWVMEEIRRLAPEIEHVVG